MGGVADRRFGEQDPICSRTALFLHDRMQVPGSDTGIPHTSKYAGQTMTQVHGQCEAVGICLWYSHEKSP